MHLFNFFNVFSFLFAVFSLKITLRKDLQSMSTLEQMQAAFETFLEENEKFVTKGNKAAAGRARKALSELAKLCKARRAEILEEKK